MRMNAPHKSSRKSTNVSLDVELVSQAKALGINLSRACETGLAAALGVERERQWKEENREAIGAWNAWIAEQGLPLAKYRKF